MEDIAQAVAALVMYASLSLQCGAIRITLGYLTNTCLKAAVPFVSDSDNTIKGFVSCQEQLQYIYMWSRGTKNLYV